MVEVFADGSSLGNPGNSGAGYVIYKNKRLVKKESVYIGEATNNFAEYIALILSLQEVLLLGEKKVSVYMDSQLVAKQVQGKYKVKNKTLYSLNIIARNLIEIIGDCNIFYKRREENELADSLAKKGAKLGRIPKIAEKGQNTLFD
ncbi:MAG: ribonuclease HI family protein [Candidatus Omnitrophica bacterium]|nr:ribonuclease HI family protein [Candidatus Omnitrophota bacterium]